MRKIMMTVMAVAVAGMMIPGCSRKGEGERGRSAVVETKIDLTKAKKEQSQDIARVRVEGQKDLTKGMRDEGETVAQKDLARERQEMAETEAHDRDAVLDRGELSGTGGSGTTAPQGEVVTGTVQAITDKNLTLVLPTEGDQLMRFVANDDVTVMRDQLPVNLQSLKAGDEVRASYRVDPSGLRILRSLEVTKVSAPQPAMRQ